MEIINGDISKDNRGSVSFVNDFDFKGVKRFYVVSCPKGVVRAWHGHRREGKYVFVVRGSALVGAVDMEKGEPEKFTLSGDTPQVLYIPSGHANGFQALTDDVQVIFFSTATLGESIQDDYRFDANKWDIWE